MGAEYSDTKFGLKFELVSGYQVDEKLKSAQEDRLTILTPESAFGAVILIKFKRNCQQLVDCVKAERDIIQKHGYGDEVEEQSLRSAEGLRLHRFERKSRFGTIYQTYVESQYSDRVFEVWFMEGRMFNNRAHLDAYEHIIETLMF